MSRTFGICYIICASVLGNSINIVAVIIPTAVNCCIVSSDGIDNLRIFVFGGFLGGEGRAENGKFAAGAGHTGFDHYYYGKLGGGIQIGNYGRDINHKLLRFACEGEACFEGVVIEGLEHYFFACGTMNGENNTLHILDGLARDKSLHCRIFGLAGISYVVSRAVCSDGIDVVAIVVPACVDCSIGGGDGVDLLYFLFGSFLGGELGIENGERTGHIDFTGLNHYEHGKLGGIVNIGDAGYINDDFVFAAGKQMVDLYLVEGLDNYSFARGALNGQPYGLVVGDGAARYNGPDACIAVGLLIVSHVVRVAVLGDCIYVIAAVVPAAVECGVGCRDLVYNLFYRFFARIFDIVFRIDRI